MKIREILKTLEGTLVCGFHKLEEEVEFGFASDLLSDVLTLQTSRIVLITGLANLQTIRAAEMADISVVIMARNKKLSAEILTLANELNITVIECRYSMFRTCGLLFNAGIKAIY